jgi:hypothetical protein
MKAGVSTKRHAPFQFVLAELSSLRPTVRQMFGFTYVYLEEKLVLSLRQSDKQPRYNGVWLYTQAEHIASLRREFPLLPRRCFWKSVKRGNGWVILAAEFEDFEEYAFRACELILRGDRRVGRVTRGSCSERRASLDDSPPQTQRPLRGH